MGRVIIANPAAGKTSRIEKKLILDEAAKILNCEHYGLDTQSQEEFCELTRHWAQKADMIIAAGGDGTIFDLVNSVEPGFPIALLPLGFGNALQHSLNLPKSVTKMAEQIKGGGEHSIDAILCEGKMAIFADIGIGGYIESQRDMYLKRGITGLDSYFRATISTLIKGYERPDAKLTVDCIQLRVQKMFYMLITKVPSQGYGLAITPEARVDDGYLHLRHIEFGLVRGIYFFARCRIYQSNAGGYSKAKHIKVETSKEQILSINGTPTRKGTQFEFKILPNYLKLVY